MTANQRRPGFRLPWSPESEEAASEDTVATVEPDASSQPATPAAETDGGAEAVATGQAAAAEASAPSAEPEQPSDATPPPTDGQAESAGPAAEPAGEEFMRDLVAAMRGVAEEARDAGVSDLRARADEEVRRLESDAERRQEDLRQRAETDVAGIGEWAKAETERIKSELKGKRGRQYWRSLNQLAGTPEFKRYLEREFPHQAPSEMAPLLF